jgi:hypothetical protein
MIWGARLGGETMRSRSICEVVLLAAVAGVLASCGGNAMMNKDCNPTAVTINPASGSADHAAAAPGNQVQYSGMLQYPTGCAVPAILPVLSWSTSDTTDTTISSGTTNPGVATCVNATTQPATITGVVSNLNMKGTATLSCK